MDSFDGLSRCLMILVISEIFLFLYADSLRSWMLGKWALLICGHYLHNTVACSWKVKRNIPMLKLAINNRSECLRQYLYIGICVESSFKFVQCTLIFKYVSVKQYKCRHYVDEMTYISYLCQIACTNLSAYVCF